MDVSLFADLIPELERTLKPYRGQSLTCTKIPEHGYAREEILREMERLCALETARWQSGKVSGAVYHGDSAHIDFVNRVYALHSQSNPLHADIWPSTTKFEAEIVAMTARMLNAPEGACGTVTSGGTESILLAMKTYRDWARATKGITTPEIIAPTTAHAAFDKAAQYFGIRMIRVPVGPDFRADVNATRAAITSNTIALVGSAPPFPHGIVDPIEELSELAREHGIGFHTDACLGGFLLPWAEKLGYPVPLFDFRLPGVTSISADTHKYGYAPKGTSVILYRHTELRHFQYFTSTDWPGGLYFSPTMAGSRPGALSAACWAAMVTMGEDGYLRAAQAILETATKIKAGIRAIPELQLIGDPLFVLAFTSESLDVFQVMEYLARKDWGLNGLHSPPAVHLCVTLRHTQACVAEQFIADLRQAVVYVNHHPDAPAGVCPIYGMASVVELRGMVNDLLKMYMDLLYQV
jgi:glutamate/tyrosine decarboxylase-like PLP-dependent enzyme